MLVLVLIGERIGGENGMLIAFAISVAMNFTATSSATRLR